MRLINTDTYLFEEFLERTVPDYAILSHTWKEEEVSYADYVESKDPRKKGFAKIYKTCELAAKENIPYAWFDICCIDKRSSAELTEAINYVSLVPESDSVLCIFVRSSGHRGEGTSDEILQMVSFGVFAMYVPSILTVTGSLEGGLCKN